MIQWSMDWMGKEMTLREEIFKEVEIFDMGLTHPELLEELTDKILKLIEKLIDKEFINLRDKDIINLDNAVGWNNALRTIKEMLSE